MSRRALRISCLPFSALSGAQIYEILALRSAVFVVEQQCIYQDIDGNDALALHLLLTNDEGLLVAYARLFDTNVRFAGHQGIGRVIVRAEHRGSGVARLLMEQALAQCEKEFGPGSVFIEAQEHLRDFYASLGFVVSGPAFIEDGIPHLPMLRA